MFTIEKDDGREAPCKLSFLKMRAVVMRNKDNRREGGWPRWG